MKNEEKKSKNDGHLVFQNEAKSYERHAFVDINLLCKFDEFMFINKGIMKPFIKCDEWTDAHTQARTDMGHFIISRPGPIDRWEIKTQVNQCHIQKRACTLRVLFDFSVTGSK